MKLKILIRSAILMVSAATALSACAEVTLNEGDPAPKLTVAKWIKGEPIKAFEPGTVYLVEFWSSWWIPSLEPLAHINRIHKKFHEKGLVVLGQNVKEKGDGHVVSFVNSIGDLMSYRVALDEGGANRFAGKMLSNWLYAAEAGVPSTFIIDKTGKICFIGDPGEIDDQLIEQVLAGTFDLKKRAAAKEMAAAKTEAWDTHNDLGKAAFKAKQWSKALSEVDELEKLFPRRRIATGCLRLGIFIAENDSDAAKKLALRLSDENRDDPFAQLRVARTIATRATNTVILETAEVLMERATSLTKGPLAEFLHTQARIAFLETKKDKAIQLEAQAVGLADPLLKDDYDFALTSFKQGKLP